MEFGTHDNGTDLGDDEGINAFNTDDALKQDVNPTHAVNPSAFSSDVHKFDMNSSRTLREKTKGEYNFSTPMNRQRDNEFDHNKENCVFSDGRDSSPASTAR